MPNPKEEPHDPLDLEAIDRDIRINELEEKVEALGESSYYVSGDCPPEVREQFLSNILAYEAAPIGTKFDLLISAGVELPEPDSLDDAALTAKLWEVINALAARDIYLCHTDHLSDRQLYEHLWGDSLLEETPIMPPGSGWMNHIDIIGSGSDEDLEISLRYYDSEEQRGHWAKEFPDLVIPPHEDPPHDRDRHLPAAKYEPFEAEEWDETDESDEQDESPEG